MQVLRNFPLHSLNTFGLPAFAEFFAEVHTPGEIKEILQQPEYAPLPLLVLGGGSNVLFTKDVMGLVLLNKLKGIEIVSETDSGIALRVASGENWHEFVMYCVENGYGGVENMSLIPGTTGAAPMQNIGAYGAEIKQVLVSVEYLDLENFTLHTLQNEECRFGYRDSIFKQELKGRTFITAVTFQLKKNAPVNTSYGAIQQVLDQQGITHPTIRDVSNAVISIRRSKLPDPALLGNAGSFFKNPEIPESTYQVLQQKFPAIPGYPVANNQVKVPAGWLIEQAGWKGKRVGNCGSHKDQALVIVNYGEATGNEIKQLASAIIDDISEKFGILLLPEVNFI